MDNNGQCCKKECPVSRCLKPVAVSVVVLMLFQFAYEYAVHGVWLMPLYKETANLWRPMEQMGMFPWCIIRLFMLSLLFAALFCKAKKSMDAACEGASPEECKIGKKHCPIKRSLCFGITLGLLIGVMNASSYLWMPIPGELAAKWFIAGLVEGILVSAILAAVTSCLCKKKDNA